MFSIGFLSPLFFSFCRSNLLGNRRLRGMRWEAPSFPLIKPKIIPLPPEHKGIKKRGGGGEGRRGFAQHNLSKWERRRRSGEEEICLRRKDEREKKSVRELFVLVSPSIPSSVPPPQKMGCTLQRARVGAGVSPKKRGGFWSETGSQRGLGVGLSFLELFPSPSPGRNDESLNPSLRSRGMLIRQSWQTIFDEFRFTKIS